MVYSLLKKRVGRRKGSVLTRLIAPPIIDLGDNCRIYVTDGRMRYRRCNQDARCPFLAGRRLASFAHGVALNDLEASRGDPVADTVW